MVREFVDQKQRVAVCFSQWRRKKFLEKTFLGEKIANPDEELFQIHQDLHEGWERNSHGERRESWDIPLEEMVDVHFWVVSEMNRRGLSHEDMDNLDQKSGEISLRLGKILSVESAPGLHQDVVDPDRARLREELLSLTPEDLKELGEEALREKLHLIRFLFQGEEQERLEGMVEDALAEKEIASFLNLSPAMTLDRRKKLRKGLNEIRRLLLREQEGSLASLWKEYGLARLREPWGWVKLLVKESGGLSELYDGLGKRLDWSPPTSLPEMDPSLVVTLEKGEMGLVLDFPLISRREELVLEKTPIFTVFKMEEELRLVYGPVLIPGVVDAQDDIISEEDVRDAAWGFLEEYGTPSFMHTTSETVEGIRDQFERAMDRGYTVSQLFRGVPGEEGIPGVAKILPRPKTFTNKLKIRESYLAPLDFLLNGRKIRKGTWVMGMHVVDDMLWEEVKRGRLKGFSIEGISQRSPLEEEEKR